MTEPVRRRSYEIWSDAENIQLVEWLRDGITLEDITNRLGRGVDAVSSHCEQMLTPETRAKRTDADLILRTHLADPNYDWRAALRSRAQLAGRIYWDQASENILRAGWDQGRPLAELMADTGASELEVARHLVWLGLAETSTEVATQLGCDPHGTLASRVRMAADRTAAAVWVLVIDGARGSERAIPLDVGDGLRAYRHVSIHATAEEADQALDRVLTVHADKGGAPDEVTVTFAERTVGDLGVGITRHEPAPALPTSPADQDRP